MLTKVNKINIGFYSLEWMKRVNRACVSTKIGQLMAEFDR